MRRLQANFSRDLQSTLTLLEQSDLGSPIHNSHPFTHKKSLKQNPIQIITSQQQHNNSKTEPKRVAAAKQSISKHRAPNRRQNRIPDDHQLNLNSALKTPISPSDPNIQSMFSLFCLERSYRKKYLKRVFNNWYKKMTRQLLLKLRKSQEDVSSSVVHVSVSNQLTQTEYISGPDSDPFSLTSGDRYSENSQVESETTEEYIPIPISSDHSETIDALNPLSGKLHDSGSDSFSAELDQNSNELKFSDSLSDTTELNQSPDKSIANNKDNNNGLSQRSENSMSIQANEDNMKIAIPERKQPTQKKPSPTEKKSKPSSLQLQKAQNEAHVPLKERFRPPPINPNAEIVKPIIQEFKSTENIQTTKPENELKRFLRQFFSDSLFEAIKEAQVKECQIPAIKIPPNIQKPWQFTEEYCDLIVDVVTELAGSSSIVEFSYEEFLDYLSNFFEKAHYQRQKAVLPELEAFRQKKFDEFLINYSINVADSFLQFQLDTILGI